MISARLRREQLFAERGGRVDSHGAAGWWKAGGEDRDREECGDGSHGERVPGLYLEKQRRDYSRERGACRETTYKARDQQRECAAKDQAGDLQRGGAESEANADLPRVLGEQVGDQGINSLRGKEDRRERKNQQ